MEQIFSILRKYLIYAIAGIIAVFSLTALIFVTVAQTDKSGGFLWYGGAFVLFSFMIWLITELVKQTMKIADNEAEKVSKEINERVDEMTAFAENIGSGDFDVNLVFNGKADRLATAMLGMRDKLREVNLREKQRRYVTEGLTQFVSILRSDADSETLYHQILAFMIKYLGANQGGIFILKKEASGKEYLEMEACYAFNKRKHLHKRLGKNEGLIGQAVIERETIYMTVVPPNYVSIRSGLGDTTPGCLLIVPLKYNGNVYGAIEIAAFKPFDHYRIDFVEKMAENLASTVSTIRVTEQTRFLLNDTQMQAEQMRAQEEEMRQNMEELQATQEEMERKEREHLNEIKRLEDLHQENMEMMQQQKEMLALGEERARRLSAEMENQLNAISASMLVAELNMNRQFLGTNELFASLLGYSVDELSGMDYLKVIPIDEQTDEEYEDLWKQLGRGESIHGTFRRLTRSGRILWLETIYSPVTDNKGKVVKILCLATDNTKRKELEQRVREQLEDMRATEEEMRQNIEEIRAIQEVAANNEARIKNIVNAAGYMIITSSLENGLITSFNPAAERVLGYKAAELIGKETPGIFHDPDEVAAAAAELSAELGIPIKSGHETFHTKPAMGQIYEREWTYITKDKRRVPVKLAIAAIEDAQGKLTGFVGMATDITEIHKTQAELERQRDDLLHQIQEMKTSGQQMSSNKNAATALQTDIVIKEQAGLALANSYPEAVLITDIQGVITITNNLAAKLLGYDLQKMKGISLSTQLLDSNELAARTIIFESEQKRVATGAMEVFAAKADAAWSFKKKDGKTWQPALHITALQSEINGIIGYVVILG